jgi:single-strand DNA-binding protein
MLNQCQFIGNLGKDPEIRTMQNGDKVANFSIAVTEKWKEKTTGVLKEKTSWIPIVIWGGAAGIAEKYLSKGSKVFVSGCFETRKWQDQSGADKYTTEIVLRPFSGVLTLLGGGGSRDSGQSDGVDRSANCTARYDDGDEVPF